MRKHIINSQSRMLPTKTVSVTEAKSKLSELFNWAVENKDEIIVESRGNPKAVIVSFDEYERLQALKDQSQRKEAIQKLQSIAATTRQNNKPLSKEVSDRLADQVTRLAIKNLVKKGKARFST